jgi:hypothetical protein
LAERHIVYISNVATVGDMKGVSYGLTGNAIAVHIWASGYIWRGIICAEEAASGNK